jgi:hypothetical protein
MTNADALLAQSMVRSFTGAEGIISDRQIVANFL